MSTPRQIQANRLNAQKSTGPRSAAGKAVSRFNALKTGIDAKSNVIPGEDPDALETLVAEYHQRFRPATPEQRFLVDSLIEAEWKLRRFRKVEAHLWQSELEEGLRRERLNKKWPLGDLFSRNMTDLNGLQRRIDSAHRIYHRSLEKLERLQAVPEPESPQPASGEPPRNQSLPSEIGFVLPTSPRPAEPMPISAPPRSPKQTEMAVPAIAAHGAVLRSVSEYPTDK